MGYGMLQKMTHQHRIAQIVNLVNRFFVGDPDSSYQEMLLHMHSLRVSELSKAFCICMGSGENSAPREVVYNMFHRISFFPQFPYRCSKDSQSGLN